jgi:hypothetical protein
MSNRESERPEPNRVPGGIDSQADLVAGADNGPDILQGLSENEPDLAEVEHAGPIPFRTPVAGARLTEEQLERDLE